MFDCSKIRPALHNCECHCQNGGWCEYHQVEKTAHYVHLCRTNASYRLAWNECRGPRQRRNITSTGPGTELKKMLGCGLDGATPCEWKSRFHSMNVWGLGGCRDNLPTITGWLTDVPMTIPAAERVISVALTKATDVTTMAGEKVTKE